MSSKNSGAVSHEFIGPDTDRGISSAEVFAGRVVAASGGFGPYPRRTGLLKAVRDSGVADPFRWTGTVILPEHATLAQVERAAAVDLADFFVFGTVRNPWERELSDCFYLTTQLRSRFIRRDYSRYRHRTFKDMLRLKVQDAAAGKFLQQLDHFRRSDGSILISDYCRFENLNTDYARIADKVGLSVKALPHLNYSRSRRLDEFYDDESRDIVAGLYRDDIECFGYAFPEAGRGRAGRSVGRRGSRRLRRRPCPATAAPSARPSG